MKLNKLLRSPKLLYFLLFLVIVNILSFLQKQDTRSLIILILIGLVTYSINENLIIVFSTTLLLTNTLFNKNSPYMEGFKDKEANADDIEEEPIEDSKENEFTPVEEKQEDTPLVIDDTATLQASYENLQKFLDSPGFNKLTEETHKLAKSQDKLMKSLSTLTPVLNDAKASIGNLDLSSYGSLTDIVMNLGKKTK